MPKTGPPEYARNTWLKRGTSMDEFELDAAFIRDDLNTRWFSTHICELAVQLARQAGEEVKRPLSRDQLARAVEVNLQETDLVMQLIWDSYRERHDEGALPAHAYSAGAAA